MSRTEAYEERAKDLFINQPAQMKLLIVVDKLLTGFDAPSCSVLYIDKSMQDHGLFQAICRTNRLDGEDKPYGLVVDYKDLFKKVEKAIAVYSNEDLDHSAVVPIPKYSFRIVSRKQKNDWTTLWSKRRYSPSPWRHQGMSSQSSTTFAATPRAPRILRSESRYAWRTTKLSLS